MDTQTEAGLISEIKQYLIAMSVEVHQRAVTAGWWTDLATGQSTVGQRDFIQMAGLVVTEITEAYDGWMDNAMDDKLPHRLQLEVELADALIRMGDTSHGCGVDLAAGLDLVMAGGLLLPLDPTDSLSHRLMRTIGFISYAIEGHRKRDLVRRDENMARAMLCIMVIGGQMGLDVKTAVEEKVAFNAIRPDHKIANRLKDGGKKE